MNNSEILEKMNVIFCLVFERDDIQISDATTSKDIENWDSLMHLTLINELETAFKIKFTMAEILNARNVGELREIIATHLNNK